MGDPPRCSRLAITPLRRFAGWPCVAPFRRSLGLARLRLRLRSTSRLGLALDLGLDLAAIGEDVRERPYVTAGFTAFLLLVPLAVTSTRGWGRRLGRRWLTLHRLVYAAAVLAVVHFLWLVKADLICTGDPRRAARGAPRGALPHTACAPRVSVASRLVEVAVEDRLAAFGARLLDGAVAELAHGFGERQHDPVGGVEAGARAHVCRMVRIV